MITRPAAFRVYGEPAPKGSLAGRCLTHPKIGQICTRVQRVAMSEDANRGRPWRRAIEKAAPVHITERPDPHQPLMISVLFAVTRTTAAAGRLYPATQSAQSVGGDLDKMVRLILDALESCKVLVNDAQVVAIGGPPSTDPVLDGRPRKVYADHPDWGRTDANGAPLPGLYCRLEPVGYIPDPLPYEQNGD